MGFWEIVRKVIEEADIVLEIVDSRFPEKTRNQRLEELVAEKKKKLLIVMNKADLVTALESKKNKETAGVKTIFVSAKQRKGKLLLMEQIGKMSEKKETQIALVGYPNTGKSSIANMLTGRHSAKTSSKAGFSRGIQKIRVNKKIMLIDTPGVVPFDEKDETLMVLLCAKNAQDVRDLESAGVEITQALLDNGSNLKKFYGVEATDGEEFLEQLALKKNKLLRKGKPDLNTAARILISDYQSGKIRV